MTDTPTSPDPWLDALERSVLRLADEVGRLPVADLEGPSYDDDWTVAQVLSHLGSGADIFALFLEAGREGHPAPGPEAFGPIWDRWNAKPPEAQAADALVADAALFEQLSALDGQQRSAWHLDMFGSDRDLVDLLGLRLGEHAVHTWDVAVVNDSETTVSSDAVELMLRRMADFVPMVGKPTKGLAPVRITTSDPDRSYLLVVDGEQVGLQDGGSDADQGVTTLHLPAEALIRLIYGRLDPEHTPSVDGDADLDALRRVFPGF